MKTRLETGAVACFLGAANPPGRRAAPTAVERVMLRVISMRLLGSQSRGGVEKEDDDSCFGLKEHTCMHKRLKCHSDRRIDIRSSRCSSRIGMIRRR